MRNLFSKTMYDKRAFIIGWGIGLAVLSYLMLIFYPAFSQDSSLDELMKNLPPALQGLVGDLANLKQLPNYLGSQLYEVRIPIFISILAIILAMSLTIGEEEKGQLRTLLALPLSRTRIFLEKWLAVVMICTLAVLATAGGVVAGLLTINETLDWEILARLSVMMWLLTICLTTIVFSVGLATGKRSIAMTAGLIVAVGSFLLTSFAKSVEWLQVYEPVSLLHYFPAVDIASNGIELRDALVYVVLTLLFLIVGLIFFRRRDVQ